MRRLISFAAVLMVAAPLFALDKTSPVDPPDARQRLSMIDEVIRMTQAGVGDDAIVSYIRGSREAFVVTSDDLIALTNARVSDRVIRELQNDAQDRRYATRSTVLVSPYAYPYYYPYPYYSPFWYGPRLSFGIVFGPRFGGFRHRW
jgi:hypothetical protein